MAKGKGPQLPKGLGDMGGLMAQVQQMQAQMLKTQKELANETVNGSAGGGAVTVTVTGDQRCTAVQIAPELLEDADVEMLQDLILTAVNNALDTSREVAAERLGPLASGLPF